MSAPVRAYVGLGGNVGDARARVTGAFDALGHLSRTRLVARSSLYRTPAWGPVAQDDYVNAVAAVDTQLPPLELLEALLRLEREAGRDRETALRWGPRTLDLDLLLYGEDSIDLPGLRVPHPRLHERAFVIVPLAEIAPALRIPGHGEVGALRASMETADIQALG
ncbi:2-amino-4-hydroxy-6-hydroxymethyldihydropteridine diphosphokinase [Lysobacter sp. N42]|uniref:2-amino-4-hydroxy-6- hydroxymethyldihydropteridine diphosphokinase n=1 Tax=Lysobacter sp. N42 TaxID=2545719 RepID=UPI0010483791|nr:2-amino-4-hydroxy-6-hydroxymethyldihydropteridine diphosphokinase [Lysobacter sp. N42]TCZ87384.1 2-amino-4-hydroxy-6-hydroxymethyldihydropteridine diphosphokinase [Lysobacter sp. N42]